MCPGSGKISWGVGTLAVLSIVHFKCPNCRAQNGEKWSQQWWMKNCCPSLGKFKLEDLVELCHLSPALLLWCSIQACNLEMGFPWAFTPARLCCPNVWRKQTEKSWEAWAKGIHFQTTSNTSPLNVIPFSAPGCERWLKIPVLFTLLPSTYIVRYNQCICSRKFEQRMCF